MSISKNTVDEIREGCERTLSEELKGNKEKSEVKKEKLKETEKKLFLLEEKWISN